MRSTATALLLIALPGVAASQFVREQPVRTFTVIASGPPPSSLTASALSTSSIALRWGCPEGASGYDVWATSSNGVRSKLTAAPLPGQCVQNLQAPGYSASYIHSGLLPAASWSYTVVALYPNGAQGASAPVVGRAGLLPAPAGFHVQANGNSAALGWNYVTYGSGYQVSYATGYQVFRQRPGESAFTQVTTTNQTFYEDQNLILGQRYNYYVRAIESEATAPLSVVAGAPSDPSIVASCAALTLDFRWGGTTTAISAKVLRAGTPSGPWYSTGDYPANSNSFARTSPQPPGVVQYYKVVAVYPAGQAESVVIPISFPSNPAAWSGVYTKPVGAVIIEWQCH